MSRKTFQGKRVKENLSRKMSRKLVKENLRVCGKDYLNTSTKATAWPDFEGRCGEMRTSINQSENLTFFGWLGTTLLD